MSARVYTKKQAAELLQVKESWLSAKCELREVPFTLLGGSYRFTPEHLDAIIRQFEERPKPSALPPAPRRQQRRTPQESASVTRLQAKTPPRLRSQA